MAIKHRIVFKKVDRDRGTNSATGDSLDLSDDGILKPEQRISASDGESARRGVPADDRSVFDDKTISNDYKSGGAYKAIMDMFAEQLEDKRFQEHCKKFFKGDNDNT
jgi:hypothetical protein